MTAGVDGEEFAAMLAEAAARRTLAAAFPETGNPAVKPPELRGVDGKSSGDLASPDYRITGNTNPVITASPGGRPAHGRCRAACGTPMLDALCDPATLLGLHPTCAEPTEAPSTLAEIERALARFEASRPRSVQRTLGPSELGTPCTRQMAMKLAGVAQHERGGLPWAPMCGTAVHSLMESVLEAENARLGRQRYFIEETVHLDDELTGHGDAYDADHALVIDWKYTGTTARRKAARRSVPNADLVSVDYRVQAHLYGLGHENAGRPVRHVRLVMLARSHDFRESVEWTEEYRPDIALDAMTRFYATRDRVVNMDAATHPERLADIEAVPGDACKWCPFQRPTPPGGKDVDATGCVGNTGKSTDINRFF